MATEKLTLPQPCIMINYFRKQVLKPKGEVFFLEKIL